MISLKSLEIKRQDYDYASENKVKGQVYATVSIDGKNADMVVRLSPEASMKLLTIVEMSERIEKVMHKLADALQGEKDYQGCLLTISHEALADYNKLMAETNEKKEKG